MKRGWLIGSAGILLVPFLLRMIFVEGTLPGTVSYRFLDFFPKSVFFTWIITIVLTLMFVLLLSRLIYITTSQNFLRFVAIILIITAPSTLYFATFVSPYLWALVLFCCALNVFHSPYRQYGVLFLMPLAFFDWITIISVIVLGTAYLFYANHRQLWWMGLFVLLSAAIHFFVPHGIFYVDGSNSSLFSDFGGLFGLSLFAALLALLGLARSWVKKVELVPAYGAILVLSVLCLWNIAFLLFLAPILLFFAAYACTYFWKRQWSLPFIRFLTLAVLVYGLAFSTIAYIPRVAFLPPEQTVLDSISWLQNHPNYNNVVVLVPPDHGYWFEYGGVTPFVTEHSSVVDRTVAAEIFASRDFKKTEELIRQNKIGLIWISDAMRDGDVWQNEEEGMLFLLKDDRFIQVYDSDRIEMWRLG
jgi:hypothetical protein